MKKERGTLPELAEEKKFREMQEMNVTGSRLRKHRLEKGYTLDDACVKLGGKVKPSILGKYERGERNPKREGLEMLSKLYDVDVDYLTGLTHVRSRAVFSGTKDCGISDEEKEMLELFSKADSKTKELVFAAFDIFGGNNQ